MSAGITNEVRLLIVGLVLGSLAISIAAAFRDCFDTALQIFVPVNDKLLGSGWYLLLYRLFLFLIILSMLVALSILLV
jgi:hypothetical protein